MDITSAWNALKSGFIAGKGHVKKLGTNHPPHHLAEPARLEIARKGGGGA